MADFHIEKQIAQRGFNRIAGIDEAGRGALFGPVVSAAVMFPSSLYRSPYGWVNEINDSKLLSVRKREQLFPLILTGAKSVGIGFSTNLEIDRNDIFWATLKSMKRAVHQMTIDADFVLVDGCELNDVNCPQKRVVKGDQKSISIAAASIVAKVLRDQVVIGLSQIFDGYALEKNKGYGTREHYTALKKMGATVFHRKSFHLNCGITK
ncbi:MAG: ribonuclease HII [Candidatus Aminicenantes bacterium]|nr:ribonuclease HII [Candidatus Aminicenantes bacterium]